tara:strand:- start:683 stop:2026 length:1344 start_codon:yes stop_codon:yes gene_type:complete
MNQTLSLTRDPIPGLIRKIALPASVGTFFQTMYNIVDTFFAGKISPEALSALAKSFPIYFIIIAACIGVTVGGTSLIANSIGEGNKEKILSYFSHTIIYGILVSIVVTLLGLSFARDVFILMGSTQEVISLGLKYTDVIFSGSIIFILVVSLNALLHADGDTKTYRNILILSFFLNIILNPIFIFGFLFIPAMGITGIGVATIISQLIALLILLIKIFKNERLIEFSIKYFNIKFNFLKNLFFQSAPISAALLSFTVGNTIILAYVGIFGEFATAGYGSATRFEQVLLLPVLGLNTAIISIIAQNYGAKNFLRVKESYFKAITYGFIIMIFSGIIVYLSADKIVSIFSENPNVIEFGAKYLKISAFVFPAYPIFFISNGLFMSLKRSGNAMISNIIRNIVLPLFVFYFVKSMNGDFNSFFWTYCITNWLYVSTLFIFVIFYIKRKLN